MSQERGLFIRSCPGGWAKGFDTSSVRCGPLDPRAALTDHNKNEARADTIQLGRSDMNSFRLWESEQFSEALGTDSEVAVIHCLFSVRNLGLIRLRPLSLQSLYRYRVCHVHGQDTTISTPNDLVNWSLDHNAWFTVY
jgi:hypothetical protein